MRTSLPSYRLASWMRILVGSPALPFGVSMLLLICIDLIQLIHCPSRLFYRMLHVGWFSQFQEQRKLILPCTQELHGVSPIYRPLQWKEMGVLMAVVIVKVR